MTRPSPLAVVIAGLTLAGLTAATWELTRAPETETAPTTVVPTTVTAPITSTTVDANDLVATGVVAYIIGDEVRAVRVPAAGVTVPVTDRVGDRWQVRSPCGREATVAAQDAVEVVGAHVVLDAGHGGAEPGAVGPTGLTEASLNLAVTLRAAAALEARGLTVVLTRDADQRVTLATRTELVGVLNPLAFVSIHHNAEPDGPFGRPGTETYFQVESPASHRLSGLVYESVVAALSQHPLSWVADTDAGAKYRRNDRGEDYYGILRRTAGVPSTLAELAFVTNPPEEALLRRPEVQDQLGRAVAEGIVAYLRGAAPGDVFTEPYPRTSPAGGGGAAGGCVDPPELGP